MSINSLQNFTFYSKYAKYNKDKKRRETWKETVERVFKMHETKYEEELSKNAELRKEFQFAKEQVLKKRVLGAQRALQFGGEPILRKQERIYNCATSYLDRPRAFQEIMYLLLCGCGVGFSVQLHHINKLPEIASRTKGKKTFQIPDSIEGWADAIGVLINSYFVNNDNLFPEYQGYEVIFDYSLIRPEGALISGGFKAPGSKGLEKAIGHIQTLIEKRLLDKTSKLSSLNCYDAMMFASDAVLSGGLRRSATICLFSPEDEEMMSAKTGKWFIENPQRGRSNNSVVLIKGETDKKDFLNIFTKIKEFGEPGFLLVENNEIVVNPCQPAFAPVLTKNGISTFDKLSEGDEIWSESGWTKVLKKWSNGNKEIFCYRTTAGAFYGTSQHRIVTNGQKIEVGKAESIDLLSGEFNPSLIIDNQDVLDGLVIGDGSVHKASNNLIHLYIGADDQDYLTHPQVKDFIIKFRPGLNPYAWEIQTTLNYDELPPLPIRVVPDKFYYGNQSKVAGFLRGLYSANGSVAGGRVTLKSTSFKLIEQVQTMLSSLGIRSYYTTNKASKTKFANGEYLCKESYDLNISTDRNKFAQIIGFLQQYKTDKLDKVISETRPASRPHKNNYEIINIESLGETEVFDITVDNETHTYWTGGVNVSNCVEIAMYPQLEGESGVQFCNLCEINAKKIKTEEDFIQACRAAAIIGTLQAGYTTFPYLGEITEKIVRREALLGVSMTGIMDSPEIVLDPDVQKKGARAVKETNKKIASLLNINPAARTTCVKPAGSTSCILGSSSGIHPHHAKRYIRRVQANKLEWPVNYFKQFNPLAVEESVWSANKTDLVVSFLCEIPNGSITKNQVNAIQLLENVKTTQQNWVEYGTNEDLCVIKNIRHNVSNTITVKPDEWDEVGEYIYKNRKYFAGISLLPFSGDKDYPQAPFTTIYTAKEIVELYGEGAILASGLIVDGLKVFDNNLWAACDTVLGHGEKLNEDFMRPIEPIFPDSKSFTKKEYPIKLSEYAIQLMGFDEDEKVWEKVDWVRRAKQFAERYFSSLREMTYCLKDTYNWKLWLDLKRDYKDIDWSEVEEPDEFFISVDTMAASSCSGGACEVNF